MRTFMLLFGQVTVAEVINDNESLGAISKEQNS